MTERCENPTTANDWICGDPDVVADHANDPFNNFTTPPNIRSLYYLVVMMETIIGTQWAEKNCQHQSLFTILLEIRIQLVSMEKVFMLYLIG
ncbi:hypothetical protein GCM10020331_095950 [Ectobacillus funiculus]